MLKSSTALMHTSWPIPSCAPNLSLCAINTMTPSSPRLEQRQSQQLHIPLGRSKAAGAANQAGKDVFMGVVNRSGNIEPWSKLLVVGLKGDQGGSVSKSY